MDIILVYKIDSHGCIEDVDTAEIDKFGNILEENKKHMVTKGYQGLYRPKWNGSEWVEGESEQEKELREYNNYIESIKPSQQEIQKAQLEIEVLNIINELGVIS